MDKVTKLAVTAEQAGITIDYFPFEQLPAMSVYHDGRCSVAVNSRLSQTVPETVVDLAHELGHCMTYSFYNFETPLRTRSRCENRANRWAVHKLMPWKRVVRALYKGLTEVWELADYFDVTEDFVHLAISQYRREGKLA